MTDVNAAVHGHPGAEPVSPRHIFIVSYGRSGSTLLMNVFNAIPDVLISGENCNFLYSLWRARQALADWREFAQDEDSTHPFYGSRAFDFDSRDRRLRDEIGRFFDGWRLPSDVVVEGSRKSGIPFRISTITSIPGRRFPELHVHMPDAGP